MELRNHPNYHLTKAIEEIRKNNLTPRKQISNKDIEYLKVVLDAPDVNLFIKLV